MVWKGVDSNWDNCRGSITHYQLAHNLYFNITIVLLVVVNEFFGTDLFPLVKKYIAGLYYRYLCFGLKGTLSRV